MIELNSPLAEIFVALIWAINYTVTLLVVGRGALPHVEQNRDGLSFSRQMFIVGFLLSTGAKALSSWPDLYFSDDHMLILLMVCGLAYLPGGLPWLAGGLCIERIACAIGETYATKESRRRSHFLTGRWERK